MKKVSYVFWFVGIWVLRNIKWLFINFLFMIFLFAFIQDLIDSLFGFFLVLDGLIASFQSIFSLFFIKLFVRH